jgi:TRADD-N domain-containing protein
MEIEVILSLPSSVGAAASAGLLKEIYEHFVDVRKALPKEVAAPQDIESVKALLEHEEERLGDTRVQHLTIEAIDATYSHLEGIRSERLRQAKASFNTALVLVVVGVLTIFGGVFLL